jgi:hypothetical protein
MSRWADAFRASSASNSDGTTDVADTIDTTSASASRQKVVSVCVTSVSLGKPAPREGRASFILLDGYQRGALVRPPAWPDPAALPSPGCFCSCCKLGRWWCELVEPKGWRCWTCHPPDGAAPGTVRELRT